MPRTADLPESLAPARYSAVSLFNQPAIYHSGCEGAVASLKILGTRVFYFAIAAASLPSLSLALEAVLLVEAPAYSNGNLALGANIELSAAYIACTSLL